MSADQDDLPQVTAEFPPIDLVCPACGHEEQHSSAIFSPLEDGKHFALGQTNCSRCEQWFKVLLR